MDSEYYHSPKYELFHTEPTERKTKMSLITIVNVEITSRAGTNGKKGYEQAEVVYKQEYNGKQDVKTKKIMSFANPAVFAAIKSAKTGETYEVTQVKEGEFWQWTNIVASSGASSAPAASAAVPPNAKPTATANTYGRDFETATERAEKQRLIVRQSSLSNAVAMLVTGAKTPPNVNDVKKLADELVAYVYNAPDLFDQPNDLPADDSDIPY
jgi:hypothetical protein